MTDSETNWPLPGRHMATLDKAQVAGVLPHGKTRTRGPPRIEHLGIGTRTGVQPFEEIESQVIEAIVHTKPVKFGTAEFFHNAGLERRVTETGPTGTRWREQRFDTLLVRCRSNVRVAPDATRSRVTTSRHG